jgi:cobalt-zinc-cadmium efflux system membrane fusion protein
LGRVHQGSPVVVRVVAYPDHAYHGQVDWISEILDPATRTARIRVVLDNDPKFRLRPDMFATAEVAIDPVHALAIREHAVIRMGETTFVFVERGTAPDGRQRFERVPVVLDPAIGVDFHPVTQGLTVGERIATNNAIQLSGML